MKNKLKHYFIPHEGNSFKPHFLEKVSMGIMLFLVLLTFTIANIQSLIWISSDWLVSTILPSVIVDLTNDERTDDMLSQLSRNDVLDTAAQMKAEHMAKNGYFAHDSPDGISPWHWFKQAGYEYAYAGENLAVHFTDSEQVVDGWMNSPTHRANIMSGNFAEIGVGTARGEYKGAPTIFVVQLFGTPKQVVQNTQVVEATAPDQVLAQAETIEVQPPEEVVANEEDVPPLENIEEPVSGEDLSSDELVQDIENTSETLPETEIFVEENAMYSQTTTTGAIPAAISENIPTATGGSSLGFITKATTQPHVWMQMLYATFAFMVVVALGLSIVIEWQRQNPVQIAYATSLLLLMGVLLRAHTLLTSGVIIV